MDKHKQDANVSVSHGSYSTCSLLMDVTLLEVINRLCTEASTQGKTVIKAKITMKPQASILMDNKSL